MRHVHRVVAFAAALLVFGRGMGVAHAAPPPDYAPTVLVHIEADRDLGLETRLSPGAPWVSACLRPCDAPLPLGYRYRIAGRSMESSDSFLLDPQLGPRVVIHVTSVGSPWGVASGALLVVIGPITGVAGLFIALIGSELDTPHSGPSPEAFGVGLGLAGVAMLAGGIALIATNASTSTTQTSGTPEPTATERAETAWLRTPTWRETPRLAPSAVGLPLFTRSF